MPPSTAWLPYAANPAVKGAGSVSEVATPAAPPAAGGLRDVVPSPRSAVVTPKKGAGVFVAPSAVVLGHVSIGDGSSVWYGATLRGDVNAIRIGRRTSVQDNVVIHCARHTPSSSVPRETVVGDGCTIAHGAIVHAATVGDGCLVGMGATLLDGAVMEPGSVVAAGSVVTPGTVVKSGQVYAGSPARPLRALTAEESSFLSDLADGCAASALDHRTENGKAFEELLLDAAVARERRWRERTDIDVHQGIYRDPQTQAILSMR